MDADYDDLRDIIFQNGDFAEEETSKRVKG